MKKIYFCRHGQTVWNVENKICGAIDSPLTEKGYQQALDLAQKIKESNLSIDKIYYSPLSRAKNTALTISKVTHIPAYECSALMEQNFGKWESTPRDGQKFKLAKMNFIDSFEGGESMFHVVARIYRLLEECQKEEDTILLVAHNGISRIVQSYFCDMTNEEFSLFGIENCAIMEYDFDAKQAGKYIL